MKCDTTKRIWDRKVLRALRMLRWYYFKRSLPLIDADGQLRVAYLYRTPPVAKFKCAPFLIIQILNVGTVFTKVKP